jgi:hypothetical protein
MADKLSKTAKASMRVETGGVARTPCAWVFKRKGGMQTRPYAVCFVAGEAEAIAAGDPERLYVVKWAPQAAARK